MQKIIAACFMGFVCLSANAQPINLQGTISNTSNQPVDNAIVTLVSQNIHDTTGSDGKYSLVKTVTAALPEPTPHYKEISMSNGLLRFLLNKTSSIKIEIFDVNGSLIDKQVTENAAAGTYSFDITKNCISTELLIVKAAIGTHQMSFRYIDLNNGHYSSKISSSVDGGLARMAVVEDTLKVTADGYKTKTIAINSYDQELDVTLDAEEADVQPSAGCGKSATFSGEKRFSINVSAAGAGNREYFIRLPDDYDPDQPYALWFANHCLNGSAENVAHSEPDNRANYEYLGMWKLANPVGKKGTTIFVAPEGISAGWGQGERDLAFFRAMIDKFENELCIDKSRIFASGFSMGGSMSYALACAMPDKMRAIAMHSGGNMSGCDQSNRGPVPIFITHGTNDGICRWPQFGQPQINDLAERNGCQTEDLARQTNPSSIMSPECIEYKGCDPGYPARACIFKGDHIGSPGTQGSYGKNDTWAPDSAWSFFKRFY